MSDSTILINSLGARFTCRAWSNAKAVQNPKSRFGFDPRKSCRAGFFFRRSDKYKKSRKPNAARRERKRHSEDTRPCSGSQSCLIFSTMGETAKEESPKSVDSKRSWFILAVAFLSLFGVGGLQMSFGTILAHLVKQFDESKSKTGKMIKWNWVVALRLGRSR